MPTRLQSQFVLNAFERGREDVKRLRRYLDVYLNNISPENRTDTNELIAFLSDPFDDRKIVYFGLEHAGNPCGFATLMYYPKASVAIVDHLAIDATIRGQGAFFAFCELLAEYLKRTRWTVDYVLVEIMKRSQSLNGEVNPLHLVRLLRFVGFKAVQLEYVAPHSGIVTDSKAYRSVLMIVPLQFRQELGAEECRKIVELIYFDHYLKWYTRAWGDAKAAPYKAALQVCFEQISERISAVSSVRLNGSAGQEDDALFRGGVAAHARDYSYAAFILVPAALTIGLALVQDAVITGVVLLATLVAILLAFVMPSWRRKLMEFLRLG